MQIRAARIDEIAEIMEIYARARSYMREQGNPTQWGTNYPSEELVRTDILRGCCRVCEDEDGISGVFYFAVEEDPTYREIFDGAWQSDAPYAVVHRIAVGKHGRGVAKACFEYAYAQHPNIRIDTHRDNLPMQRALAKNGFVRCGTIYLADGEERVAYQKI
jgi:GNAT superfamily N-acetyltransferase